MIRPQRFVWLLWSAALGLAAGCAVTGVGVGYDGEAAYGGGYYQPYGYYEPYGYEYGGWGPGYRVGPRWGGGRRDGGGHAGPGPQGGNHGPGGGRPYRPAAPNRSMPSIPGHPRGH
jgi:hypothetical protein